MTKIAILLISAGLILLISGLILGLRNIRPVHMNVISGIVIIIGTIFGLFGKQLQDSKSSEKSDTILKTGQTTNDKVDSLKDQNSQLQIKADSLSSKLETQAQTIDKLRTENTDLYTKLSKSQHDILLNTERGLQPLLINNLTVSLSYDLDNPVIHSVKTYLLKLKKDIETECAKYPPAVDGQRAIPSIPGIIYFPTEDNKINTNLIVQNQEMIRKAGFDCPNIVFQVFNQYPSETREKMNDGTFLVKPDISPSLELTSKEDYAQNYIQNINADFINKRVSISVNVLTWQYTKDDGKISSFKDLFDKYLKVSAYYNYYEKNTNKMQLLSATIINNKRLYSLFLTKLTSPNQ